MSTTDLPIGFSPLPDRRLIVGFAAADFVLVRLEAGFQTVARAARRLVETASRRRWRRRAINELRGLSNRMLTDIGLDRSMIVSTVLEREETLFGRAPELEATPQACLDEAVRIAVADLVETSDTPVRVKLSREEKAAMECWGDK